MLKDKGMVEQKEKSPVRGSWIKDRHEYSIFNGREQSVEALNMVVKSVAAFKRQATLVKQN